jgi:hypothetical protein
MVVNRIIESFEVDAPTSPAPTTLDVNYKVKPLNSVRFININLFNVGSAIDVAVVEGA